MRDEYPRATARPGGTRNMGDPQMWGQSCTADVPVRIGASSTAYRTPQGIRVGAPGLLSRGWLVVCSFLATGLDLTPPGDIISYLLDVDAGGGLTTVHGTLDMLALTSQWALQANSVGAIERGTFSCNLPIPAAELHITPRGVILHAGGPSADHVVNVQFDLVVSPWSLS